MWFDEYAVIMPCLNRAIAFTRVCPEGYTNQLYLKEALMNALAENPCQNEAIYALMDSNCLCTLGYTGLL